MLTRLEVRDLALVERCALDLEPGLTLLTGETGSGKSLLVDALSLAIGSRARPAQVRRGARHARIEARFAGPGGSTVLSRTIGTRGAAAIDGATVAIAALAAAGRSRVAIHGQHDQQALADGEEQARLLDAIAGSGPDRERMATAHAAWEVARVRLEGLRQEISRSEERREFDAWRLAQLRMVGARPGEDDALKSERARLRGLSQLREAVAAATARLGAEEGLELAATALGAASAVDARLQGLAERLRLLADEAREGALELRRYADGLESDADPGRLEEVENRLAALEELKRRHGGTLEAVLEEQARLEAGADRSADDTRELELRASDERAAHEAAVRAADALTRRRVRGARTFAMRVRRELSALGLADAELEARLLPRSELGPDGAETVELWFAANPGEGAAPLARVASGGELSRVMLAIETATAEASGTATLVFDEVDAGIGGSTALEVGRRLRALGRRHQVLVVSHLAQVAAFADHQLRVEKVTRAGRTAITVERLDAPEDRAGELARMMSGAVTEKAIARAEELLQSAQAPVEPPALVA